MSEDCPYLFVYGTLRRGHGHPMAEYLAANAAWLGPATAPGALYDLGAYPGAVPDAGGPGRVAGDLYELTDPARVLPVLDEYEGCTDRGPHAGLFRRARTTVSAAGRDGLPAWVYYYCRPVRPERRIPSGDYFDRPGAGRPREEGAGS